MKPFTINRDSWHYKLNKHFVNEYAHWMSMWEAKHSSFCSYWRATIFRLFFASIATLLAISTVIVLVTAIIANPLDAAILLGLLVLFFAGIAAIIALNVLWDKITYKVDKSPSIFVQRYQVYKSRICPSVDYVE